MDLSFLLPQDKERLREAGFSREGDSWLLRAPLEEEDLYVLYTARDDQLSAEVYTAEDELYVPFSLSSPPGAFVSILRKEAEEKIRRLLKDDERREEERVIRLFKEHFNIIPEWPWKDENIVFREKKNGKWVGVLLSVSRSRLGLPGEDKVKVLNLKHREESTLSTVDNREIFPGWHMNKKYWISVLLTPSITDDRLLSLVEESWELIR